MSRPVIWSFPRFWGYCPDGLAGWGLNLKISGSRERGEAGFWLRSDYLYGESITGRRFIMPEERFAEEQAAVLGPNIDKLLTMMGAARDAFNRHSRTSLQELQNLAGSVAQDFSAISTQLRTLITRKPEAERSGLTRLLSILSPLEVIGQNLGGLTQPIEKKIKDGRFSPTRRSPRSTISLTSMRAWFAPSWILSRPTTAS